MQIGRASIIATFSLSRSILFSAVVAEETGRYATGDNEPRPSNWSPRVEDARNSSVMQPQSSGEKEIARPSEYI